MKKTITFLAAAALAVCTLAGYAADITGRVTDGAGEPLMQASVRLLKPDSAFVAGTAADLDGRFSLPAVKPGRYLLDIGYHLHRRHDIRAEQRHYSRQGRAVLRV